MIIEEVVPILSRLDEFSDLSEQGMVYGHGRDAKMRPIIIVNIRRLIDSGMDVTSFLELNDFISSYIVQNGMVPGRVEQFTVIIDVRDVALAELPLKSFIAINQRSTTFYKHRSC